MALRLQAQRIALGTLEINGKAFQVLITREWYRQLEAIAEAAGSGGGGGDGTEDALAGPVPLLAAGDSDTDPAADAGLPLVLASFAEGLWPSDADALVQQLQAQVQGLEARIEALEQGSTP